MFATECNFKINKSELLIQLLIILLFVFLFAIKNPKLGFASMSGGISALLPNIAFVILTNLFSKKISKKFFPWNFILAEIIKIFITIILLILAFSLCVNFYLPLMITWLSIKIIQILIPTLITRINADRKIEYVSNRNF